MAVKKTIELDVNTKAGLQAMDELGLSFEQAFTEADNLSGQIGELEDALYAMAAAGQQNTKEYKELSEQVGVYKKVIIDTDMQVDAMSQTTNQKLGGALGGVTSGFELGAGAMGAFGAESEEVEAALLRVQSAMAISQGVQGIREAIPAFKAMKTAIMSTTVVQKAFNFVMRQNPIGVIITAITVLIGLFMALGSPMKAITDLIWGQAEATESAAEANERLNKSFKEQDDLLDKVSKKIAKQSAERLEMMQSEGAGEKELHEQRLKILDVEEKTRIANLEKTKWQIAERQKALSKALKEGNDEEIEAAEEDLRTNRAKYDELVALNGDFNHKKTLENNAFRDSEAQAEKEQQAKDLASYKEHLARKKAAEDIHLATLRELRAHELSKIDDEFERERAIINNNFKIKREDLLANFAGTEEDKAALKLAYDEQEQIALDELHAKRLEDAKLKSEELALATRPQGEASDGVGLAETSEFENEEMKQQTLFNIRQKWDIANNEMRDASASKEAARVSGAMDNAMQGLNAVNDLSNMLTDLQVTKAGKNEEAAEAARKKGFERSKKIQLAMAVVQGVQGVMAAFTAGSAMGPAGVVMGPLMAGLAAVTAGVNIAKIKATKYNGGGSSAPSAPRGAPSVPSPNFNVVGNSSENQLASSLGDREEPVVKTFVVAGDVTSAQSLERNKIQTATL